MAGVINKIRSKGTLLLVIIGLAMFSFLFAEGVNLFLNFSSNADKRDVVVTVGDIDVKNGYFEQRFQYNILVAERQNRNLNAGQRQQLADQTYREIVEDLIFEKEYSSLNLNLSDAELTELMTGPYPDNEFVSAFGGAENMKAVYQRIDQDPELRNQVTIFQNSYLRRRMRSKYFGLIKSTIFVSKKEAEREYYERNRRMNVSFMSVNFASIADSAVQVKDEDYNQYYQENLEKFKVNTPTAVIKYVTFPIKPTKADSLHARDYLIKLKPEFKSIQDGKEDSIFAVSKSRSDQNFNYGYQNTAEMDATTLASYQKMAKDSILGPILEGSTYKLIKVSETRKDETKPYFNIRHIYFQQKSRSPQDSIDALTRATEAKKRVTPANFKELVLELSDDVNSKANGGDLKWIRPGMFGPEFDKGIQAAQKGQIIGPLRSAAGYHIVEIIDRNVTSMRVVTVANDIKPRQQTLDSIRGKADAFISNVANGKEFDALAAKEKYQLVQSSPLNGTQNYFPDVFGQGAKSLVAYALEENESKMSQVIQADNCFVVAYIVSRYKSGYKPLEAVKAEIKSKVASKAKAEMILKKLASVKTDDLEAAKASYGGGAFVSKAENISFSSGQVPGVGDDPILVGTIFKLKQGEVSKPIASVTGVYIVKVESIQEPAKLDDKGIEDFRRRLAAEKRERFLGMTFQGYSQPGAIELGLLDKANIQDYRYRSSNF